MADVFRALDDETRRLILDGLADRDGQTLFEICTLLAMRHGLGVDPPGDAQAFAALEDAGLADDRAPRPVQVPLLHRRAARRDHRAVAPRERTGP